MSRSNQRAVAFARVIACMFGNMITQRRTLCCTDRAWSVAMNNSLRFPYLFDCVLLADLPVDEKAAFLNACTVKAITKTTPVLHQGAASEGLILVAHGTVEICYASTEGTNVIIHHATPGEMLGAIEAMALMPCVATCTAFPGATLLFCDKALLERKLQSPTFLRNIARSLYDMMRRDNELRIVGQFYSAEQRICNYLKQLSAHITQIPQNQSYVAKVVGCSRQTVNKEFGRLRELGILEVAKGRIRVLDRDALARRIAELDSSA